MLKALPEFYLSPLIPKMSTGLLSSDYNTNFFKNQMREFGVISIKELTSQL